MPAVQAAVGVWHCTSFAWGVQVLDFAVLVVRVGNKGLMPDPLLALDQTGTVEGFSEFPKGFTFSLSSDGGEENSRLGTFINANH